MVRWNLVRRLTAGRLRYANNSNYRNDSLIRKERECERNGHV